VRDARLPPLAFGLFPNPPPGKLSLRPPPNEGRLSFGDSFVLYSSFWFILFKVYKLFIGSKIVEFLLVLDPGFPYSTAEFLNDNVSKDSSIMSGDSTKI
jgi:hypothetical protein